MSKTARQKQIDRQKSLLRSKTVNREDVIYDSIVKNSEKNIVNLDIDKLQVAPEEINFFPQISEEKMLEMVFSILENGLFNPIIVWELKNSNEFMILAGHNRVKAFKRIINEYKESKDFDVTQYEVIPAIIYGHDEIDLNKAKEIAIDTNYIQRKEDRRLAPKIIKNRLDIVRSRKDTKGRTINIVAEELGLSRTKVYEDFVIAENIIPELSEFYFTGVLKKKLLLKFNWYDKDMQKWMYNTFKNRINNDTMIGIKRNMDTHEIAKVFVDSKNHKYVNVSFKVPEELKDDLRHMVNDWLRNKKS